MRPVFNSPEALARRARQSLSSGHGIGPTAAPGVARPFAPPESGEAQLRRLERLALAGFDWPARTLNLVADHLDAVDTPHGAEGAMLLVRRARGGDGVLWLQLLGALALSGWSAPTLINVGISLVAGAPEFDADAIQALRAQMQTMRA